MTKTAVVLLNLGGPTEEKAIKPFLFNFFMDKNIIAAPLPIRFFIAKLIAYKRGNGPAQEAYGKMGGKSPLLENTLLQEKALQEKLGGDFKVFTAMRYWHPFAHEVMQKVKEYAPDKIVLLPLYPQFSTTTVYSSFENFHAAAKDFKGQMIERCCYPENSGFIKASAQLIAEKLKTAPAKTRLLFSAHGLPEKVIQSGDPYQWQCEKTAEAIVRELNIHDLDWQICYQSRVGPLKWIGPSTEEALEKAGREKVGVLVYPHAFVSEHVETIVEIGMEYREKSHALGIPWFDRVETVGTHPLFIDGLTQEVFRAVGGEQIPRICPANFKRCGCACV